MDDMCETQRQEVVSSDSAYGSSAVDTDPEDGPTPTANICLYNEDLTHKVITSAAFDDIYLYFFFPKVRDTFHDRWSPPHHMHTTS